MRRALEETGRRRTKQMIYNQAHGIVPRSVEKTVAEVMRSTSVADAIRSDEEQALRTLLEAARGDDPEAVIARLEQEMLEAARALDFERAASLRDRAEELREALVVVQEGAARPAGEPGARRPARGRRTPREPRGLHPRHGKDR